MPCSQLVRSYTVVCEVSDTADNKVQMLINIYVEDVNDIAPVFVGLPYRSDLPEVSTKSTL